MDNTQEFTAEYYREKGKAQLRSDDPAERSEGVKNIKIACKENDPEACYIMGVLLLRGVLRVTKGNNEESALSLLRYAANNGNINARRELNNYCMKRYDQMIVPERTPYFEGPLVDFYGKKIKIDCKGILTPIDAVLEYKDGVNTLTFSTNVLIYGEDKLPDFELFRKAVINGILMWQGDYHVFGGQLLRVKINLTQELRVFDNLYIIPMTESMDKTYYKLSTALQSKERAKDVEKLISSRRSFATSGKKWKTTSRKLIHIYSEDNRFDDYEEIKNTVKHEFGHALGLGDLYQSESDNLSGVENGTYAELDGFYITNKVYNLVMCDQNGIISNNDIEMVVLAFSQNRMQLYQPTDKHNGTVSEALGKGN